MSQTVRSPSLDAKLSTLSEPLRRHVVREVADRTDRTGDALAAGTLVPEANGEHRKSTLVELHHVHLPTLAERGFVEWDADEDAVRRGPAFEGLLSLLDTVADHENDSR
ncbi:hypothetical protein ACFO0N_17345 [Halobium salinum]|uniref:DUF7344 domain-containing protein n=1 Tax=Halobium salinum TaxID=1364940 RepID=A0ABD5PG19_9EURY|nr:hypothetical protein [Halobium salinum]